MVLVLCEMQSVSSRIWTRVAVSISYDDNHGHFHSKYDIFRGLKNYAFPFYQVKKEKDFKC